MWWKLEGKDIRSYNLRKEKLNWNRSKWENNVDKKEFYSLKEAVVHAHKKAKELNIDVEIYGSFVLRSYWRQCSLFVCPDGYVVEYNWRQKNMTDKDKKTRPKFKRTLSKMLGYKFQDKV